MDSGAGALIRNLLSKKNYSMESVVSYFEELIEHHFEYLEEKKPNYAIVLDYCDKNTYKDEIAKNPHISNLVRELILSGVASHSNKTSPLQEREYKPLHV